MCCCRSSTCYADQDYGALAEELTSRSAYEGKLIVVCWHHGNIPNLMNKLGAIDKTFPDPWKRDVFNLILDTTLKKHSAPTIVKVRYGADPRKLVATSALPSRSTPRSRPKKKKKAEIAKSSSFLLGRLR